MIRKFSVLFIALSILSAPNLYAGFLDDVSNIVDAVADELGPKFNNVYLTDKVQNDKPVGNKRVFSSDTPKIYLFIGVENMDPDSPVTASYYYQKNSSWKNVGNFSTKIPYGMNIAYFYVDRPENMMWPSGSYKIDIRYQNQIYKTINFSVPNNSSKSHKQTSIKPHQLKFTDNSIGLEIDYPSNMNISRNGDIVKLVDKNSGRTVSIKQLKTGKAAIATIPVKVDNSSTTEDDFSF